MLGIFKCNFTIEFVKSCIIIYIIYSVQNLVAAKELFVKQMHHSEQYADKAQVTNTEILKN